jgi:hypothetical protein
MGTNNRQERGAKRGENWPTTILVVVLAASTMSSNAPFTLATETTGAYAVEAGVGENLVVNGGFEVGYPGNNVCGVNWYTVGYACDPDGSAIPGWRETGEGVDWHSEDILVARDGINHIDLRGGGLGRIEQDVPTMPGALYTFSFYYARHFCAPLGVRATVEVTGVSSFDVVPSGRAVSSSDWNVKTLSFRATSMMTTISFAGNEVDYCGTVLIDAVSLSAQEATVELAWEAPAGNVLDPPRNLEARIVGIGSPATAAADPSPGSAVTGYKVYRSAQPNVQPSPNTIFGTYPPNQTRASAPLGTGGGYFVVTACYDEGESGPSNESSAGTPGASIRSMRVKGDRLVAKGNGFTDQVTILVDGIAFATPSVVKKRKKLTQRGALATGETLGQYFTPGRSVAVVFVNSDQSATRIDFVVP